MFTKKCWALLLGTMLILMTIMPVALATSSRALPSGNILYFQRDDVGYTANLAGGNVKKSGDGRYTLFPIHWEGPKSTGSTRAYNDASWEKYEKIAANAIIKAYPKVLPYEGEVAYVDMVGNWIYAFVYNDGKRDIVRINRNTSKLTKLSTEMVAGKQASYFGLAVEGDYLYYYLLTYRSGSEESFIINRTLYRLSISSRKTEKIASMGDGTWDYPDSVFLAGDYVYFVNINGHIARIPKTGGKISVIVKNVDPGGDYATHFYVGDSKYLKKNPIKSLSTPSELTLEVGASTWPDLLIASDVGTDITTDDITYTSSNVSVADLSRGANNSLYFMAKKAGSTTLTVKTSSGLSAKCKVKVIATASNPIADLSILRDQSVLVGKTISLKLGSVNPKNHNSIVTWWSENSKIATISSDGKLKGISRGSVIIRCLSSSGRSAWEWVTVK